MSDSVVDPASPLAVPHRWRIVAFMRSLLGLVPRLWRQLRGERRTPAEVRAEEKARQRAIRRELRGLPKDDE